MTRSTPAMTDEQSEIWELLPWYVNGTLSAEERARVEQYCATCPICREELAHQTRIASVFAEVEDFDGVEARNWEAIKAQIAPEAAAPARAPEPRRRSQISDWVDQILDAVKGSWIVPGASLAACAAVLLGLTMFLSGPPAIEDQRFETLTATPGTPAAMIRVQPVPGVSADALAALFEREGLVLVEGPGASGVYTLRPAAAEDRNRALAALADAPEIAFVTTGVRE
ncbi:MAG: zf-HC2 domain-containing protein [Pseudomonadota bacterium]